MMTSHAFVHDDDVIPCHDDVVAVYPFLTYLRPTFFSLPVIFLMIITIINDGKEQQQKKIKNNKIIIIIKKKI